MPIYMMPKGMRYASLEERKRFYVKEFSLNKTAEWLQRRPSKTRFAVIIGRHTRIFPAKYREDADTTVIIDEYRDLNEVRDNIIEFLPEAVYYDRNIYGQNGDKKGQELAFDIDPENITCPIHGTLADKMKRKQGLGFCELELEMSKEQVLGLHDFLEKEFLQMEIVYSGRGFHIHVFDESAYKWTEKKRRNLARKVKNEGFAIDEWVTAGEMRLIRLPFSLNGLVSRIVLPLEKSEVEKFNPMRDVRCIPKFLYEKAATFS